MKKLTIVAATLLATLIMGFTAQAQTETRWGFTAGLNMNNIHFKHSEILNVDMGFTPQAGITGEMIIPGVGFSVDASLLYSWRSGKVNYGERVVWNDLGLGKETVNMHYIDVPLRLKFKYSKLNGLENKVMPLVYAGPTFSFLAGKNLKETNSYRPVSVYMSLGVGAELYKRVQVSASYNFSIGETLRTRVLDENIAKNRCWTIQATYFFE